MSASPTPNITSINIVPVQHTTIFTVNIAFDPPAGFVPGNWKINYASTARAPLTQFPVQNTNNASFQVNAAPGTGAYLFLMDNTTQLKTNSFYVLGATPSATVSVLSLTEIEVDLVIDGTNNFSGMNATVYNGQTIVETNSFAGPQGIIQLSTPLSGTTYSLQINGTANNGISISQLLTIPVVTTQCLISSLSYLNKVLTVVAAAAPPAGATIYANFYADGVLTQSPALTFNGSTGTVTLPSNLNAWQKNSITLQVFSGNCYGPPSAQTEVLCTTPMILNAYCTANYIVAKWLVPPGASRITGAVVTNGGPASVTNTSLLKGDLVLIGLNTPLTTAPASFNVSLAPAQGSSTGPVSANINVDIPVPQITSAQFDGSMVSLSWNMAYPDVTGYTIVLSVGTTPNTTITVGKDANTIKFAPQSALATNNVTVTIRANFTDAGAGIPSAATNVSFIPGFFLGTTQPSLYPVSSFAQLPVSQTGAIISLYLPAGNYGVPPASFVSPTTNTTYFTISGSTGQYVLNILANTWAITSGTIRSAIQTSYIAFLQEIESKNPTFNAWGISVIQEAIGRYMPQNFAECLYYNYGLDLVNNPQHADLRPGMVLTLTPSDYMVVPDYDRGTGSFQYMDGYVNSAPLHYDIGSYTDNVGWKLGFDSFISTLVASGTLTVPASPTKNVPNVGGMGDAVDMYATGFKNSFYRLFIPGNLLSPTSAGQTQPEYQFNIASAINYTGIAATTNGTTGNTNYYFRGRSVVTLGIRVIINGCETIVPIGTTITNVLERYGRVPSQQGVTIQGFSLKRAVGQSRLSNSTGGQVGTFNVCLDYALLPAYAQVSALGMPLLHGDVLTFL